MKTGQGHVFFICTWVCSFCLLSIFILLLHCYFYSLLNCMCFYFLCRISSMCIPRMVKFGHRHQLMYIVQQPSCGQDMNLESIMIFQGWLQQSCLGKYSEIPFQYFSGGGGNFPLVGLGLQKLIIKWGWTIDKDYLGLPLEKCGRLIIYGNNSDLLKLY